MERRGWDLWLQVSEWGKAFFRCPECNFVMRECGFFQGRLQCANLLAPWFVGKRNLIVGMSMYLNSVIEIVLKISISQRNWFFFFTLYSCIGKETKDWHKNWYTYRLYILLMFYKLYYRQRISNTLFAFFLKIEKRKSFRDYTLICTRPIDMSIPMCQKSRALVL